MKTQKIFALLFCSSFFCITRGSDDDDVVNPKDLIPFHQRVRAYESYNTQLKSHLNGVLSVKALAELVKEYCEFDKTQFKGFMKKRSPSLQDIQHFIKKNPYAVNVFTIDARDISGQTLLHKVVWDNHVSAIESVLKLNPHVNAQDDGLQTPLHKVKSKQAAELLVEAGADCSLQDEFSHTPGDFFSDLTSTDKNNHGLDPLEDYFKSIARQLPVKTQPKEPQLFCLDDLSLDENSEPVLQQAAKSTMSTASTPTESEEDEVQVQHSRPSPTDDFEKFMADPKIAKDAASLLKVQKYFTKKNINFPDQDGKTVLHYVVSKQGQRGPSIASVMKYGPNVNALDKLGRTPLHYVSDQRYAQTLIDAKANIAALDKEGQGALEVFKAKYAPKCKIADAWQYNTPERRVAQDEYEQEEQAYNQKYGSLIALLIPKDTDEKKQKTKDKR